MVSRDNAASAGIAVLVMAGFLAGCSSHGGPSGDDPVVTLPPAAVTAVSTFARSTAVAARLDPRRYVYTQGPETSDFYVDNGFAGVVDPTGQNASLFLQIDSCMGNIVGTPSAVASGPRLIQQSGQAVTSVNSQVEIVTPEQRAVHVKEPRDQRLDRLPRPADTGDGCVGPHLVRRPGARGCDGACGLHRP